MSGTKESQAAASAKYRARIRTAVFDHYGWKCACCGKGESNRVQITIDHIEGGGNAHRASIGLAGCSGSAFHKWLYDNGFPEGYQTLCEPCNKSKADGPFCRMHAPVVECIVERCHRAGDKGHGYCNKHFQRWWKYGDPLAKHNRWDNR